MPNYKMIRGRTSDARCVNDVKGCLYCDCGCHVPREGDPVLDLTGVTIGPQSRWDSYADYPLYRGNHRIGSINTQYLSVAIIGDNEYLQISRDTAGLDRILAGREAATMPRPPQYGDTLEETAAAVASAAKWEEMEIHDRNKQHPGWCRRCGTTCYGDCASHED